MRGTRFLGNYMLKRVESKPGMTKPGPASDFF